MGILDLFRRRRTDAPALPPARADGAGAAFSAGYNEPGIGLGCQAERVRQASFVGRASSLSEYEVDALMRYHGVARRICTVRGADAVRRGVEVEGISEEEQRFVQGELESIRWWRHVVIGRAWANAYGGALTIFDFEGDDALAEPVKRDRVAKVRGLVTVNRERVTLRWPRTDLGRLIVEPKGFRVDLTSGPFPRSVVVHPSRCVVWRGLEISGDSVDQDDRFWGGSLLDLVDASLARFGAANQLSAEMLATLTQEVLTSPYIGEAVQMGGAKAVQNRAAVLKRGMSVLGMVVLQGGLGSERGEEYSIQSRSVAGAKDLVDSLRQDLVATTGLPRIKLYGEQPGGLGEQGMPGELRVYYDSVEEERPDLIGPATALAVRRVCETSRARKMGFDSIVGPENVRLVWPSLVTPTEAERLANRKAAAEARKIDIESGVITEDEARQDPDLADHYPTMDPEEPAPGKPEASPIFGDSAPVEDEEPITALSETPAGERLVEISIARAHLGGVGPGTIRGLARSGKIRLVKIGGRVRVVESDVIKLKEEQLAAGVVEEQPSVPGGEGID